MLAAGLRRKASRNLKPFDSVRLSSTRIQLSEAKAMPLPEIHPGREKAEKAQFLREVYDVTFTGGWWPRLARCCEAKRGRTSGRRP